MLVKRNRPYVIRDHRDWLYTGVNFVSPFSQDAKQAMHFVEWEIAEGIARHICSIGPEAFARRSTYDECRRLEPPSIRSLAIGEKLPKIRLRRLGPVDTSEYWPHR